MGSKSPLTYDWVYTFSILKKHYLKADFPEVTNRQRYHNASPPPVIGTQRPHGHLTRKMRDVAGHKQNAENEIHSVRVKC